jgi:hypothetical protein
MHSPISISSELNRNFTVVISYMCIVVVLVDVEVAFVPNPKRVRSPVEVSMLPVLPSLIKLVTVSTKYPENYSGPLKV